MASLRLSLAISDYDHTRDLTTGRIRAEGIELTCLSFPVEEIFYRFLKHREWDVSELSFAKYLALASQPDCDIVAIPVFPSRMFRQSSIYVRSESTLERPEDLRGKRVGLPEWAQTAAVYTRGWLANDVGVALREVEWVQAGVNQPGRREKVSLRMPDGVRLTPRPDESLDRLLQRGELDAVFSAHPPAGFGSGVLRTLLRDPRPVEEAYYRRSGVFPIMHVVAIRRVVLEGAPWVARNLLDAFGRALATSLERAGEITASRFPMPWGPSYLRQMQQFFGGEPFRYGVEENLPTLDAFTRYAHQQGLTAGQVDVDSLFAPGTGGSYRI